MRHDFSENNVSTDLYSYIETHSIDIPTVFIDIGANDGIELSNSYLFCHSDLKFHGLLVEPQPHLKQIIYNNYQNKDNAYNVEVASVAISNEPGFLTLTGHPNDDRNSRSSEKNAMGASLIDRGGKKKWNVWVWTCEALFTAYNITEIGIFSVDTEGLDLNILKSLFETQIRPSFIITEDWSREQEIEDEKHKLLIDNNYKLIIKKPTNLVYQLKN